MIKEDLMSAVERVSIHDEATGSMAEILVGFGLNCYRFRAGESRDGIEVIWAEDAFETGTKRPSGSGIPILFPFPGRIRGNSLSWEGKQYSLPEGDGQGNAIHGFVHCRPWRIIEQQAERIVAQFNSSQDDAGLVHHWPAGFRITATYAISGMRLSCRYFVENSDDVPLPCGLGLHPYFRLPTDPEEAAECIVTVPVTQAWELMEMNATGRRVSAEETGLAAGLPFSKMNFDGVFGGLAFTDGWCRATIDDPARRSRLELSFDEAFRECVVYNPPHRQAVCLEPYTCVPDCFRLEAAGIDAGLRVLEPGDAFTATVRMEVGKMD
jgi:aldose 1-epimerase